MSWKPTLFFVLRPPPPDFLFGLHLLPSMLHPLHGSRLTGVPHCHLKHRVPSFPAFPWTAIPLPPKKSFPKWRLDYNTSLLKILGFWAPWHQSICSPSSGIQAPWHRLSRTLFPTMPVPQQRCSFTPFQGFVLSTDFACDSVVLLVCWWSRLNHCLAYEVFQLHAYCTKLKHASGITCITLH